MNDIFGFQSGSDSYKVYTGLISHYGVAGEPPIVVVLKNDLGINLDWVYGTVGNYYALVPSYEKVFVYLNSSKLSLSQLDRVSNMSYDAGEINIITAQNGVRTDGLPYNTSLEIRVYN